MKKEKTGPVLTKHELARLIGFEAQIPQTLAAQVVQLVFGAVAATLVAGGRCEFRDFGVFTSVERKARLGRNPHAPEKTYDVPGRRGVRFRAGRLLRAQVSGEIPPEATLAALPPLPPPPTPRKKRAKSEEV